MSAARDRDPVSVMVMPVIPGSAGAGRRTASLAAALAVAVSLTTPEHAAACTLTTTGPVSVASGALFTLTLGAVNTGDGLPTSWTISWGDGAIQTFAGNPASVTHTYTAALTPSIFTYNILASATCGGRTYFQNNLVVASAQTDQVNWYAHNAVTNLAVTRAPVQSGPNGLNSPLDAIVGPDGNVYVSGLSSGNVVRFNATTGAFISVFATGGTNASGMAFGPDGHLYVADAALGTVRRYNRTTGAFIDNFVTANLGGINEPEGLKFGPDGHLYVADFRNNATTGNAVYRYNGRTGAFIDKFVASGSGGLRNPEDLVFGPDGNLYVASDANHNVLRFQGPSGASPGAFMNIFVVADTTKVRNAQGVAFGPDGHFYVSSFSNDNVVRYNGTTGAFIDVYVSAGLGGINIAEYFDFIPGHRVMVVKPTAVELMSFGAVGREGAVDLEWETGSELHNLGFHLYRSLSESGPFERITGSLIPGLGSSPEGARYGYRDEGRVNGVTYYYELEDVETTGQTKRHGPVWAVPGAGAEPPPDPAADGSGDSGEPAIHGDPSETSLTVLEHDAQHALLELRTGGFYSRTRPDGTVEIRIPGFESTARPGAPDLPTRSTWIEAMSGRRAVLTFVQAQDTLAFTGLPPAPAGTPGVRVSADGKTVRPTILPHRAELSSSRGISPRLSARVLGTGFQQETKKAHLELAPLRFNASTGQLLLARRLLVRVDFTGKDLGEISLGGSKGRRPGVGLRPSEGALHLLAPDKGLYRVVFEDVFAGSRAVPLDRLRLSRQGEVVPFHVDRPSFGPGASLYFVSEGASLNPHGSAAVYELVQKRGGLRMATVSAVPSGPSTSFAFKKLVFEQNKTYQSGLLEAPDLWFWEVLVAPVTKSHTFTIDQRALVSEPARLSVDLQGGSDFEADPDHHVRLYVNGAMVGEASWDGRTAKTIEAEVATGILLEGANTLQVENVGDTAASSSMVLLDRFSLSYPRLLSAEGGVFEGTVSATGTGILEVSGLASGSLVVDTTAAPLWLTGATSGVTGLSFHVEAGRRFLGVSPEAVLRPEVRRSSAATLRRAQNQADYLLLAPREFLPAAKPLLELRQSQGLRTRTVALEDVYDQFGFGEEGPAAVKAFLSYAYHSWKKPSPRYVLLLGDATYDPKDFTHTGTRDRLPTPLTRTTFIWTASDPFYAQVNGDDLLPDFALGRLPAANLVEAQVMIDKILAFEEAHRDLSGPAVLVADNEDDGGPFEKNADAIAALLPGRSVEKLYLSVLSAQGKDTRTAIANALDGGASLMSYVGHGSIAVWASENVWNNLDVSTLKPQPLQPILLTLDCLNGFFHFPPLNSLTEQMVKAEGKGALAAISPSGLSLDQPAHLFHQALVTQLVSSENDRLGDAFLAAQADYTDTGAFPELLAIYHLFGDPAMKIH